MKIRIFQSTPTPKTSRNKCQPIETVEMKTILDYCSQFTLNPEAHEYLKHINYYCSIGLVLHFGTRKI